MPSSADNRRRLNAQSGLADAVRAALARSEGNLPSLDTHVPRGGTIHLGAEYLAYARSRLSPNALKKELESRLAPVVARSPGPAPGKAFGKFLVKAFLGKGGMAEVFLAQDPERSEAKGQDVALKVMRDDIASEPTYIKRFLREAANAGLIEHPNVVAIHEVGAVSGRIYFTMELVQGQTLKDRLAAGSLGERDGLEVLRQITAGLVATHERGVGHRDLKPSNVMLADATRQYGFAFKDEASFHVKLMDFGLARMYAEDDEPETDADGRILGTAKYVAPELIEGKSPTIKADVFSLGIIAFQLFTGRSPWKARNKLEYLEANVRSETPQLGAVAPNVSPETSSLVAAMLEKDPEHRPSTKALLRDLDRILGRRERPADEPLVVLDDVESVFYTRRAKRIPGARSGSRSPRQRNAAIPALIVLSVVVAALVVLAVLLQSSGPLAPPRQPSHGPRYEKIAPRDEKPPVPSSDEMALGKLPPSLASLGSSIREAVERTQFVKLLEAGDRAWADNDPEYAHDRWQDALGMVGEAPELSRRVRVAARELALKRAASAEKEGKTKEASLLLDDAESKGAPAALLSPARARLRQRASDEKTVEETLALVSAAVARGDFEGALEALRVAEAPFTRLARETERETRIKEVGEARVRRSSSDRLQKLVAEASQSLERGELEPARAALDSARAIDPKDARVSALTRRLGRLKNMPRGRVCVELGEKALYVRREAVSNREYKAWLDALPVGKRRAPPWIAGDFAPADADRPVKNVKEGDARAFAESRAERLPQTAAERDEISRALKGVAAGESVPDPRGVLGAGFRTVQDVPEERPP